MLEAHPQEVSIYTAENGCAPYSEWIWKLQDVQGRAVIRARINRVRVENFGNCEPVGDGVFELKIHFGPGYHVYFGREGIKIVVLLCGGDKGSQESDIKKAREYWLNYKRRGDYGEE